MSEASRTNRVTFEFWVQEPSLLQIQARQRSDLRFRRALKFWFRSGLFMDRNTTCFGFVLLNSNTIFPFSP